MKFELTYPEPLRTQAVHMGNQQALLTDAPKDNGGIGEAFSPTDLVAVRSALQEAGIDYDSAEASFQASVNVPVDAEGARKVFKLIDALEDSDDVQNVWSNVDLSDEVMAELNEED